MTTAQGDSMIKLSVGSPWPFGLLGYDNLRATPDGASLTLVAELGGVSGTEARAFRKATMRYGLLTHKDIPFVLLAIPGLGTFDCYLNIHLEPQDKRDAFLAAGSPAANLVQMYLVDATTGILRGIRAIGTQPGFVPAVKAACFAQLTTYSTAEACAAEANALLARYTTDAMIKAGKMYKV